MTSPNDRLAIDGGAPTRTTPFHTWPIFDEREEVALLRALHSGHWGFNGTEIEPFEVEFAAALGVGHAHAVTTGTAALEAALYAAGVEYGDEVIVPPYTFFATASACLMRGAIPVFADIHPTTYCLDPAAVEAAITPRTRCIMPVHIGGYPADMKALLDIARRHKLRVIEDACQAHGATWQRQYAGGIGDLGCFSFQSSKNMNCGEGGIVVTNDAELAGRCWSFRSYGRDPEGEWYQHDYSGTNFRMTQFQAALLRAQLSRLEEWAERRAANGAYLAAGLRELGIEAQGGDPHVTRPAYHIFITRYNAAAFGGWPREKFLEALVAEGIPAFRGYHPLYQSKGIQNGVQALLKAVRPAEAPEQYALPHCPVTARACDTEAMWLLNQSALLGTTEDMDDVLNAVAKIKSTICSI